MQHVSKISEFMLFYEELIFISEGYHGELLWLHIKIKNIKLIMID